MNSYANRVIYLAARHVPADEKVREMLKDILSRQSQVTGRFGRLRRDPHQRLEDPHPR